MLINDMVLETVYEYDPDIHIQEIVIVGAGGTGSVAIRSVARMVYDLKHRHRQYPRLRIVDPDVVEQKNVGRQMFTPADIGHYKAAVLGRRFNLTLGMDIVWHTEPFDADLHIANDQRRNTILLGCVDNTLARRAISQANLLWVDCGNHFDTSQVVIGSTHDLREVKLTHPASWQKRDAPWFKHLPTLAHIFPSLLEPEAPTQPQVSCADLVEQGDQHLLINEVTAGVAANYVYRLLHRKPIREFCTFISIDPMQTRSEPITATALRHYVPDLEIGN